VALARFARANIAEEIAELSADAEDKAPLVNLSLTSLALTFQRVLLEQLTRARSQYHVVVQVPYTVDDQKAWVASHLAAEAKIDFINLLKNCGDKLQMVYTFMAVLEMLNDRTLTLFMDEDEEGYNRFSLGKVSLTIDQL
jgi:segregation and condensation protein A